MFFVFMVKHTHRKVRKAQKMVYEGGDILVFSKAKMLRGVYSNKGVCLASPKIKRPCLDNWAELFFGPENDD